MSLIRNGHAVSTRRGFPVVLFPALLGLALLQPAVPAAQEVQQVKLTEKHIQGFMASHEDMAKLYDGASLDNSDPKIEAQAEAVVKKNGFANLAEYDVVSMNISMIMSGIDPQTRKFTEPPDQIRKEIASRNPSRRRKRKRTWRSSRRRSRAQSPLRSRKTSRWC